ncbi:acyl-CoA N-acyltransferase [Paraphaeosphaeria sporulosa]|uniref:Acyl-CoA N-acyltransferase n=1 Tax=Paraphaeosphaeria sporulosa TaxID=1460663 RepID=A0A177CJU5_9PLEO|nr:acyl-CoA N-acyltransferase [Paraphaeosphaeria sporulosa]OAG07100.1 acyl-CoA N-acyltransferase [Paraphaeosphaeria sporulosa]
MPLARRVQPPASLSEHNHAPTQGRASEPAPKRPPAPLFSTPPLPENVEFAPLTHELIPSFKRILSLTLPVSYPAVFFTESMDEPFHSITLMALWHPAPVNGGAHSSIAQEPRLVGAIRCRILPSANLYISTISLLAPYRSHGIATHLLQKVAAEAVELHGVRCVTAHVWEANEEGLEWYKKRGFDIVGKEDAYYHKLKPQGAILVRKWIGVADLLAHPDAVSVVDR